MVVVYIYRVNNMYDVWSSLSAEYEQSCSWSAKQGKLIFPCLSPLAPENSVSRDGFGRPVPRQPAHYLHSN